MNQEQRAASAPMSLRAYGRHRKALGLEGGSHEAVRQAIIDRRIVDGVTANGKIIVEIADAEWERNTGPRPRVRSRVAHSASSGQAAPSTGGPTRQVAPSVASSTPPSFGGSHYPLDPAPRENV